MRKLFFLLTLIVLAVIGYNYLYQSHRDIESEDATYSLTATELYAEFETNPLASQNKYLNKTIEISGFISEKNEAEITLEDKAFCQFSIPINKNLDLNSKVNIKGRFIGFDDLLEQVKLDQCIIN